MNPLDKFGLFVMEHLRDRAIAHCDGLLTVKWQSPNTGELQRALAELTPEQREVVRRCVIACTDAALRDFLLALQKNAETDNDVRILVDGSNVVGLSHAIYAEPSGDDGWRELFSRYATREMA